MYGSGGKSIKEPDVHAVETLMACRSVCDDIKIVHDCSFVMMGSSGVLQNLRNGC